MLLIEQLTKSYPLPGNRQVDVLNIPLLRLAAGEKAALVGPSGSGKSTLLLLIAGIARPSGGSIRVNGTQLELLGEAALDRFRAQQIGFVFQSFNLLPGFSAQENVLAAMQFGRVIPPAERRARAARLLTQVGLGHRLHHKPGQLSSGEQQRVAIARALANRPTLVLADEPTASLDRANTEHVFALLSDVCREHGAGLLLSTHDPELAGRLERIIHLRDMSAAEAKEVG